MKTMMRMTLPELFFVGLVLAAGGTARADTVWFRDRRLEPMRNVTITRIEGGRVHVSEGGSAGDRVRALSEVERFALEGEPSLSAGEAARARGRWDEATDAYTTFVRSTPREDLRAYACERLAQAAVRAGRPEAAVGAYAMLVSQDPALASERRPTFAGAKPGVLEAALASVDTELARERTAEQRVALLWLQADLARILRDIGREAKALEQLIAVAGGDAGGRATGLLADLKLAQAQAALSQGDFPSAQALLTGSESVFDGSGKAAAAMLLFAEVREAQAKTPETRSAAALDYLRVQAHFPEAPEAPRSVLAAGRLLGAAGDAEGARRLYQSLIRADFPICEEARRALAALP